MNTCNFCKRRDFTSPQSVYAHLKWCTEYPKYKHKRNAALGSSLRQAVPKAQPIQATSPLPPSTPPPHTSDPLAPFGDFLQGLGVQPPNAGETQETPQQKRRRLLQAAKSKAIDRSWGFPGMLTAEMCAAARLAIDRELRNEPLEEFSSQEVIELADSVRDRVYASFWNRQKMETQRIQEADERKRAAQRDADRQHNECIRKKAAFLNEAQRRVILFLNTCSLSPLKRLQVLEEILSLLDQTITGDEPLSEAYAALDAILATRVTELNAQKAARETKQQKAWQELAMVVVVVITVWILHAKSPELLQWLLNILSSETAEGPGSTPKPTTEAAQQPSEEHTPRRPIRRIRRPPQSPPPATPSTSPDQESEHPFV
jgi:hypothetical protein